MVCPCSSWYFTRLAKQETLPEPFPKINTSATRVAASGRNWPLPASGRKWPQVAASGRKWPLSAISISTLKATSLQGFV